MKVLTGGRRKSISSGGKVEGSPKKKPIGGCHLSYWNTCLAILILFKEKIINHL